jgi:hypothetical protein
MNDKMDSLPSGRIKFNEFEECTTRLLVGSRVNKDLPKSVNVQTMIEKANDRHPGILSIFEELCETAHPSYVGLADGYSKIDHENYETIFRNFWIEKFGNQHEIALLHCLRIFEDEVWVRHFEALAKWLVDNDQQLEHGRACRKTSKETGGGA